MNARMKSIGTHVTFHKPMDKQIMQHHERPGFDIESCRRRETIQPNNKNTMCSVRCSADEASQPGWYRKHILRLASNQRLQEAIPTRSDEAAGCPKALRLNYFGHGRGSITSQREPKLPKTKPRGCQRRGQGNKNGAKWN